MYSSYPPPQPHPHATLSFSEKLPGDVGPPLNLHRHQQGEIKGSFV